MAPRARFVLGLAVSAVLLGALAWAVDLRDVGRTLVDAPPKALAIVLGLHILILVVRVGRWGLIVEPGPVPPGRRRLVFDAVFFGWFANHALPAKAGEVGRPLLYARRSGRPFAEVLATVAVERVLDLVALAVLVTLALGVLPVPEALPPWIRWLGAAAGGGALLGFVLLRLLLTRGARVTADPTSPVGRLAAAAERFRGGLRLLARPRAAANVLGWTLAIWALEGCAIFWTIRACGAEASWGAAFVQVTAATIAVGAPSAPGGLGVNQWVSMLVLEPYGVARDAGVAVSLLDTASVLFWVLPFGLWAMVRQAAWEATKEGPPP